ncbi:amidohydrolase [Aliidongia dinghuensis]|uniref:Amidohydrolase n=1 Tax=Aliidongia dinghuensis TaxID=1867774 RepID=A0A8J2YYY8_9PROT|nr:amidohydrolase family protein [Aliidongia dinghuensis]GGF43018.1 amidohydrolase [Aliidongia dinghuensis]
MSGDAMSPRPAAAPKSANCRLIDWTSKPPLPETSIKAPHLKNYDRIYASTKPAPREETPEEALAAYLAAYDAAGASHVVIKARDLESTFGVKITNEDVAAFCARHGERFIGFAGVDPHKGPQALRELEHAVKELGLRGLNLQCFEHKLAINDPRLYPLYAKCVELDIPVNIHCGVNFSTESSMAFGRPYLLDEVMIAFPGLRACAAPPGWPWVHELIAVAWKHVNLTIGLVFVRPKYLTVPESGYGPLLQYGKKLLRDRIIFGSGFPTLPLASALAEIDELPIDDETKDLWRYGNAARLLRL